MGVKTGRQRSSGFFGTSTDGMSQSTINCTISNMISIYVVEWKLFAYTCDTPWKTWQIPILGRGLDPFKLQASCFDLAMTKLALTTDVWKRCECCSQQLFLPQIYAFFIVLFLEFCSTFFVPHLGVRWGLFDFRADLAIGVGSARPQPPDRMSEDMPDIERQKMCWTECQKTDQTKCHGGFFSSKQSNSCQIRHPWRFLQFFCCSVSKMSSECVFISLMSCLGVGKNPKRVLKPNSSRIPDTSAARQEFHDLDRDLKLPDWKLWQPSPWDSSVPYRTHDLPLGSQKVTPCQRTVFFGYCICNHLEPQFTYQTNSDITRRWYARTQEQFLEKSQGVSSDSASPSWLNTLFESVRHQRAFKWTCLAERLPLRKLTPRWLLCSCIDNEFLFHPAGCGSIQRTNNRKNQCVLGTAYHWTAGRVLMNSVEPLNILNGIKEEWWK